MKKTPKSLGRQPDRESVWDYPRPPRLEPVTERLRVESGGVTLAETVNGYRLLETSHPPVYYFPPEGVAVGRLRQGAGRSWCEWKGRATYWSAIAGDQLHENVAWSYLDPAPGYQTIAAYYAFYASRVDACWVGDERVQPQSGDFYGGWVTRRLLGPFKGGPGTQGW